MEIAHISDLSTFEADVAQVSKPVPCLLFYYMASTLSSRLPPATTYFGFILQRLLNRHPQYARLLVKASLNSGESDLDIYASGVSYDIIRSPKHN